MQTFNYRDFVQRNKVYTQNLDRFLGSSPHVARCLNTRRVMLAGGAIRRMVENNPLESDYDFFVTPGSVHQAALESALQLDSYIRDKATEHHVQFSRTDAENHATKVQVITAWQFNGPEPLMDFFDFTMCQCVYDGKDLYFGDYTLFDIANKRLAINKVRFHHSTLRRMLKYGKQGYYACAGTLQTFLHSVVNNPTDALRGDIKYVD